VLERETFHKGVGRFTTDRSSGRITVHLGPTEGSTEHRVELGDSAVDFLVGSRDVDGLEHAAWTRTSVQNDDQVALTRKNATRDYSVLLVSSDGGAHNP